MRRENAVTISSQATPSPDRARRTSSAPLISADAFKASKFSSPNGLALTPEGQQSNNARLVKARLRYQRIGSSDKNPRCVTYGRSNGHGPRAQRLKIRIPKRDQIGRASCRERV